MSKLHHFYSAVDLKSVPFGVQEAIDFKKLVKPQIGLGKTMVLLFFNSSLRTRLSTEIAAQNLGMKVITMDMSQSWKWELEEGTAMRFDTAEHIKDAAKVISAFADIIGIRAFPTLKDKEADYQDNLLKKFMQYADVPVVNMESAIRHPLQSLTDMMTIKEFQKTEKPKVVLTWAPHPKALPQAVSNSFLEWAAATGHEVTITHPKGYELSNEFTEGHTIEYDQKRAFAGADFIYAKNWSSFSQYGKILDKSEKWRIDEQLMSLADDAKFMHCMPIRRNVVATDAVLDSPNSLLYKQAKNRLHAAEYVINKLLKNG
jgi:N-succinyl-L-ornithine transcarbamylase